MEKNISEKSTSRKEGVFVKNETLCQATLGGEKTQIDGNFDTFKGKGRWYRNIELHTRCYWNRQSYWPFGNSDRATKWTSGSSPSQTVMKPK